MTDHEHRPCPARSRRVATMLRALIIVALLSAAFQSYAETKWFFITDESGGLYPDRVARLKDGTPASTGLYVQLCFSGPNATFDYAPPTNCGWAPVSDNYYALTNYLPPECGEYQVGSCRMGDDDGGMGLTVKPGSVSASIGSSDVTRRGWLRCFSGTEITNSAYYGDAVGDNDNRTFNTLEHAGAWDADPAITNVNPAYIIPCAVTVPDDDVEFAQTPYRAEGYVPVASADNNLLTPDLVSVQWDNISIGTGGIVAVAATGDWLCDVIISNRTGVDPFTNVVTFRAVGVSVRPGLPTSMNITRYIIGVPEPGSIMLLLSVLLIHRRKTSRTLTLSFLSVSDRSLI